MNPMSIGRTRPRPLILAAVILLAILGLFSTHPSDRAIAESQHDQAIAASQQVIVPGNRSWVDTGINVAFGTGMSFSAYGYVNISGGRPDGYKTPAGGLDCIASPSKYGGRWLLMGAHCWSLIARVGNGSAFEIGASASYAAPNAGTIYLSVNDESLASFNDNSGEWAVTVSTGSGARKFSVLVRQPQCVILGGVS
jgi:hypothetical protein